FSRFALEPDLPSLSRKCEQPLRAVPKSSVAHPGEATSRSFTQYGGRSTTRPVVDSLTISASREIDPSGVAGSAWSRVGGTQCAHRPTSWHVTAKAWSRHARQDRLRGPVRLFGLPVSLRVPL